ncbi:hypothetical protein K432DRAFT_170924 [Lepidopterella palustris CBS 459.81]|uniref:Uncharacterized protein n=1 Tax=Lepidopterella palustris CBS 459.81 TaxID=1314670 RepID=A0A8E2E1G9_9PEZI|nr:hypothetical protein K432DRAFT_170924 [Lepidopterella palustris CBS 459.81]
MGFYKGLIVELSNVCIFILGARTGGDGSFIVYRFRFRDAKVRRELELESFLPDPIITGVIFFFFAAGKDGLGFRRERIFGDTAWRWTVYECYCCCRYLPSCFVSRDLALNVEREGLFFLSSFFLFLFFFSFFFWVGVQHSFVCDTRLSNTLVRIAIFFRACLFKQLWVLVREFFLS